MIVLFELMSNGQNVDGRPIFDLVEHDAARAAKWYDKLSKEGALGSLPKNERRAAQVAFDFCGDGVITSCAASKSSTV